MVPEIYGVNRPLDPSPALSLDEIGDRVRKRCHADDIGINIDAAEHLFGFVRPKNYACYDHQAYDLPFGPKRKAQIRINHFVVDGERGVFQFVYPRRKALTGDEILLMGSLIHHNYVQGDFGEAEVEIVDLSCPDTLGPRGGRKSSDMRIPRLHHVAVPDILSRSDLAAEVQSVHDLLLEIGDEPDGQ